MKLKGWFVDNLKGWLPAKAGRVISVEYDKHEPCMPRIKLAIINASKYSSIALTDDEAENVIEYLQKALAASKAHDAN